MIAYSKFTIDDHKKGFPVALAYWQASRDGAKAEAEARAEAKASFEEKRKEEEKGLI